MKNAFAAMLLAVCLVSSARAADEPKLSLTDLKHPESVCYGLNGLLYVSEIGEFDKDGDGQVSVIENGKAKVFATGLNDPKGIVFYNNSLYVTDKDRIVKIDEQGKTSVYADAQAFPNPPLFFNDIAVDVLNGIFLVSDSGDREGTGGAVYRIDNRTKKIDTVVDAKSLKGLHTPNGLTFDGASHFLVADFAKGLLHRVKLADRSFVTVAEGLDGADGLVWDYHGRLFVTSWKTGKTFGIPQLGLKPILLHEGLKSAADSCLHISGEGLVVPDMMSGTLAVQSTTIPGWEVDESPLAVEAVPAFPDLQFTGWSDGSETGKVMPLRPILLTHANDGSKRLYVPTQQGVIHSFENSPTVKQTKIFLDISSKVRYKDDQNEEGFLGLAFHPKFKQNHQFFVFYTDVKAKMTNVLSRFSAKADNPLEADPASEVELIRFERPFWNHDGGTIAFGPDGYLYVALGDGGNANDPHKNGQNLKTMLGKVLRIDVDHKSEGKNYSIPADNPFVKQPDALPEIWAYGLRNIWRMAFDRKTGELWAGEVGQNLFEEIDIIKSGGNYGWNLRESYHPFGAEGVGARPDLIEPIWEYHHDIGKSITGGVVYRGQKIPELDGLYLYADYISTRLWALKYDAKLGRVTANHTIVGPKFGVMSFGEDEAGEVYIMGTETPGRAIQRLVPATKKAKD